MIHLKTVWNPCLRYQRYADDRDGGFGLGRWDFCHLEVVEVHTHNEVDKNAMVDMEQTSKRRLMQIQSVGVACLVSLFPLSLMPLVRSGVSRRSWWLMQGSHPPDRPLGISWAAGVRFRGCDGGLRGSGPLCTENFPGFGGEWDQVPLQGDAEGGSAHGFDVWEGVIAKVLLKMRRRRTCDEGND
jgi:hypothetical protein